ncbi:hypothetical protein I5Q34_34175 [Streptomyces sp. AV19]|uniref:hypothetical protein n=1 Tax=Streptomyces sp. AV19 TaxID=2793068 RepID=UPI0018FEA317|nr:hypothetical protein [Streptomyces sp. AV19]MBH1939248.1 hypothetical protein [Streptomyces sp. AV19]MDG4531652.1 hypothetical protein [Streptomyces sp. AV19]
MTARIRLDDLTDNDLDRLYDRLDRLYGRLDRIAAEHHRNTDSDDCDPNACSACSKIWPCPTYQLATGAPDTPPNT